MCAQIGAFEAVGAVQFGTLGVGNHFEARAVEVGGRPRVVCVHHFSFEQNHKSTLNFYTVRRFSPAANGDVAAVHFALAGALFWQTNRLDVS